MQKWEYAVEIRYTVHFPYELLNEWGNDGWELITVVVGELRTYFYFKRPRVED